MAASWDAVSDVDAFVDEVRAEFVIMTTNGTRLIRPSPRKWRATGHLSGSPFGTL